MRVLLSAAVLARGASKQSVFAARNGMPGSKCCVFEGMLFALVVSVVRFRQLRAGGDAMKTRQTCKVTGQFRVEELRPGGRNWVTVFRGNEADAASVFQRQLELFSAGRFRLLDPDGHVIDDRHVQPKLVC
jgi:hypothetical protein